MFKKEDCLHDEGTFELSHLWLPTKVVCKKCNKTINGDFSLGNTTIEEFLGEI